MYSLIALNFKMCDKGKKNEHSVSITQECNASLGSTDIAEVAFTCMCEAAIKGHPLLTARFVTSQPE